MNVIDSIMALDENELIRWSNLGLVKRAHKDLEKEPPVVSYEENQIKAEFSQHTCNLSLPLEKSTCTCASRELCRHVIAAILFIQQEQIKAGYQSKQQEQPQSEPTEPNPSCLDDQTTDTAPKESQEQKLSIQEEQKIKEIGQLLLNQIKNILEQGIVRHSEFEAEQLSLLAVICHKYNLASLEKRVRQLQGYLEAYKEHKPSVDLELLFSELMRMQEYCERLITTTGKELVELFGNFKESYEETKNLNLFPIGQRMVHTDSGYEGVMYYFLNQDLSDSHRFFTYSQLRPTFYDTAKRKNQKYVSHPWGLTIDMEQVMKYEVRLEGAKLFCERLSSSQKVKALLLKPADISCEGVFAACYNDFEQMLQSEFERPQSEEEQKGRLVLLLADHCLSSTFDEIHQQYQMVIADAYSHVLEVRVTYKGVDKALVNMMDAIGQDLLKQSRKPFLIFASAYIKDGKCLLYPIELYDKIVVPPGTTFLSSKQEGTKGKTHSQGVVVLLSYMKSVKEVLYHILQSGFTAYEETAYLGELKEQAETFGLGVLSEYIHQLCDQIKQQLHLTKKEYSSVIPLLDKIYQYVTIGEKKLNLIQAFSSLYHKEVNV